MSMAAFRRRTKKPKCPKCRAVLVWKHWGSGKHSEVCKECGYESGRTRDAANAQAPNTTNTKPKVEEHRAWLQKRTG